MTSGQVYSNTKNRQLILISGAVFLACMTPRFIGFMKINVGFYMSYYSLVIIIGFLICRPKNKIKLYTHYNIIFIFILWLATIFSILLSVDYIGWTQYFFYTTVCILFMSILLQNNSNKMYEIILDTINFVFLVHVLIGFYEVLSHSYIFEVGGFSGSLYGKVPVSIFYNPNDYSMFVSTMLPLVLYTVVLSRNRLKKVLFGATAIGAALLLITTMSRASIMAMFASAFIFLLLLMTNRRYKGWVLLIFSVILLSYFMIPQVNMWVNKLILENSIDATSKSDYYRINLIKNGLYFLSETHGMGVGAGSLKKWFELHSIYNTGGIIYIHNWYVEILVTFGVLFFILYIFFHLQIFVQLYKKVKKRDEEFGLTVSFLISFLIFSVTSISSSSNIYSEWVWMYLALMVSYVEYCRKVKRAR